jgi:hypothetical protein
LILLQLVPWRSLKAKGMSILDSIWRHDELVSVRYLRYHRGHVSRCGCSGKQLPPGVGRGTSTANESRILSFVSSASVAYTSTKGSACRCRKRIVGKLWSYVMADLVVLNDKADIVKLRFVNCLLAQRIKLITRI